MDRPDRRNFCFQAFTNHKFFFYQTTLADWYWWPKSGLGTAKMLLPRSGGKWFNLCAMLDTQLFGDAFMSAALRKLFALLRQHLEGWTKDGWFNIIKNKQVATDTSLVLGKAVFLPNHHWGKIINWHNKMKPINISWETESCPVINKHKV